MNAKNLIEILEAIAYNTKTPLEELEILIDDPKGYSCEVCGYRTEISGNGSGLAVLFTEFSDRLS